MSNHLRRCPKHQKTLPCVHCALTQKSAPTAVNVMAIPKSIKVPVEQVYCLIHAKPKPCPTCFQDEHRHTQFVEHNELMRLFNQIVLDEWKQAAKAQKLQHVPAVGDWNALDVGYDAEVYRKEINTGLRYTKRLLTDFADSWKGFDDLRQIVDIEIWKASRHYKERMNGALAYTIAKNQAGRFLKDQIEEQTIQLENSDGTCVLDEFGKPRRIPRHISLDDKETEEDGEPRETSLVEEKIVTRHSGEETRKAWVGDIRRKIPLLEKLVSSWIGAKKAVGEALLKDPESTVRDVPGVPKSTAARVRKTVLAEFRAALGKQWDKTPFPETY